ncbi:MAG: hypothetical protein KIT87_15340 [Anaerolineae bacterium]|nr:hypothetical protein [Anaerolineae bacterium]
MLTELRRFFLEEEGEIIEWAVFMLILLAFTVAIILAVGQQANDMWNQIQGWLAKVLGSVPRP